MLSKPEGYVKTIWISFGLFDKGFVRMLLSTSYKFVLDLLDLAVVDDVTQKEDCIL